MKKKRSILISIDIAVILVLLISLRIFWMSQDDKECICMSDGGIFFEFNLNLSKKWRKWYLHGNRVVFCTKRLENDACGINKIYRC